MPSPIDLVSVSVASAGHEPRYRRPAGWPRPDPLAVEHRIEIVRQPVPFISGAAKRYALAQSRSDYFPAGRDDFFDPRDRTPRCGYASGRRENEKCARGPDKTGPNFFSEKFAIVCL